ncbi:DUF362 domain-containing protein [Candidatus Woesearchaeota archaeon]|nr:DUF362 domain-containing protein [Candidatus Woesearchaeota archaeon]
MKVYFAPITKDKSQLDSLGQIFRETTGFLTKGMIVGVKLHFGEYGNTTFLRPVFIRKIVDLIKDNGSRPFLTDTNTLYVGRRRNSVDHIELANLHGFSYSSVNAPIIIADGVFGTNSSEIKINEGIESGSSDSPNSNNIPKHYAKVKIARDIAEIESMIVVSHFKGHMASGFGGAIKNLSMGCSCIAGKQQMHSDIKPTVNETKCTACGICGHHCPANAITFSPKAEIDHTKCIGCSECSGRCQYNAINIRWDSSSEKLQEKMAEYALGTVKTKKNLTFINFLMDITPDCDCWNSSAQSIVPNIGILASSDPVAIDQASYDLVNQQIGNKNSQLEHNHASGSDKFRGLRDYDPTVQIKHAEKLGLGTRKYELVKI